MFMNQEESQACNEYIQRLIEKLPEIATTKDLIHLGIFSSEVEAFRARKKGYSPDYIQFPNRTVLYPKKSVEAFLTKCIYSGSKPRERV